MTKRVKCDGFLGCRTTKEIEEQIKSICLANNRNISDVLNYLHRIFLEDFASIRTKFLKS